MQLEDSRKLSFLRATQEAKADLPFVFYQKDASDEFVRDALAIGANDVIQPSEQSDRIEVLAARIAQAVTRYRTEQRQSENQRRFDTLVSNLPGIVYRCSNEPDWPMEFVSRGCEELTGYAQEELIEGEIDFGTDVIHSADHDRVWEITQTQIAAGKPFNINYQIETADGQKKWVTEKGCAIFENGEIVALEGFISDISEQKRQTRRVKLLNRVLRHNLRNSMNVVIGYTDLIADQVKSETEKEYADVVSSTAHDVAALSKKVGQIQAVFRPESPSLPQADLSTPITDAIDEITAAYPHADIGVESNLDVRIKGPTRLQVALQHALENAIVHSGLEAPPVVVETRLLGPDNPRKVQIQISDEGPGIPEMERNALDERQAVSDLSHGSGLGLWVMKWYIESIGGELTFSEHNSCGATVVYHLPKADDC
ncbi:hypothetical protein AUR64_14530 [Haloprofundus marisrubri]|uniref:histidine kinase n=1 Tax=Haloprofundus marisrubri TaxID=1514971 RepID=A0A0W1R7C0_9EURY|nr:HAMP domain-containing sensor histidine kinase [Haloprofundus marisrubri]KTG09015.1 hypothetical protein AUR64_14530 [Haloprofundus marisrubri]